MDVSFTAREGSENCQALSRCTTIIWIIGSQPVWQRLTEARVQFPDPLPTAPHPQPCLPHVGYQERKDAEHPQVCCTQNNLYRTMYLLPGRLRGRESPGLRPGGGSVGAALFLASQWEESLAGRVGRVHRIPDPRRALCAFVPLAAEKGE